MSNLNPVWKIGYQVAEALKANGRAKGADAKRQAARLLTEAGLGDADRRLKQYPHEFSGGMRQRTLIAIGLAARPKLLIADEPTSALDVTVQRQILDHLETLTDGAGHRGAADHARPRSRRRARRAARGDVPGAGRGVRAGPPRSSPTRSTPTPAGWSPLRRPWPPVAPERPRRVPRSSSVRSRWPMPRRRRAGPWRPRPRRRRSTSAVHSDVLTIENLTKVYKIRGAGRNAGDFKAVDDVSLHRPAGDAPPRSWASPARASRRWPRWSCGCRSRPPAGCCSTAWT